MIKKIALTLMFALMALSGSPALAQEPDTQLPESKHRLDLGLSTGWNGPAGTEGVEADFRVIDHLSIGLGAGSAAWGLRFTPQVRAYPFGINRAGLFLEAGLALNTGGSTALTVNGQVAQTADLLFTPAANAALGYRFSFGKWVWMALRAGWSVSLRSNNVSVRGGGELDPALKLVTDALSPGGPILGLTAGVALL